MSFEEKARQLGYLIDAPPAPSANYVPAVQTGRLVYTSGSGPIVDNQAVCVGRLGENVTPEEGYEAARITAINLLAVLRNHLGTLDRISRIVKLTGFVASAPDFSAQPRVVNGASDLLAEVFGEQGRHARCAVGVSSLPRGMALEIELVAEITD